MTAKLPFTQASVRRAIAAARAAGLRVVAIRADGTVIVCDGDRDITCILKAGIGDECAEDQWSRVKA